MPYRSATRGSLSKKKSKSPPAPGEYKRLLARVSEIITSSRRKIIRDVNITQVITYWHIGRLIVEYEQEGMLRAEYGSTLLTKLSEQMVTRFGKGFSETNLKMMRLFYHSFPIRQTVSDESAGNVIPGKFVPRLSWSHYCELLKEDNPHVGQAPS